MATTDWDFKLTRNEIIQRALRLVGALSTGEVVSAEQYQQGYDALNSIIKGWQARHVFLWAMKTGTVSILTSTKSYTLTEDPPIIYIERAWIRKTNDDNPMELISWSQYQDIPDKDSTGEPYQYTIDNKSAQTLWVWPKPDANYTMAYLAYTKLSDWDSSSGTGDLPAKWQQALTWTLAHELGFEYGLKLGEIQLLEKQAEKFFREAQGSDIDRTDTPFLKSAF